MEEGLYLVNVWLFWGSSVWIILLSLSKRKAYEATVSSFLDAYTCGDVFMKKIKREKKAVDGFVTIEYTLLIPVLLIFYTFLICMGLYQYNECLLRTNMYLLGCEGARLFEKEVSSKIEILQNVQERLYYDKYLLVEDIRTVYSVKGNHIEIHGNGKMPNPLAVLGIGEDNWELSAVCDADVINAAETLRLCKMFRDIVEENVSKEEVSDES